MNDERVTLVEASAELGWPYRKSYDAVLAGELEGDKRGGHWQVTIASVKRLQRKQQRDND